MAIGVAPWNERVAVKMPRAEYCDFVLLTLSQRRFLLLDPHCDSPPAWKFRAADGYRCAQAYAARTILRFGLRRLL
jgi:hypothetical protein